MRWLTLDFEDDALFGSMITPESFLFIRKHMEAFKQMWHDQGKTFWVRFLVVYRSSFLNHGRALQYLIDPTFPFCPKRYLHCIDNAFINLHKSFIEGSFGCVKSLVVNLAILTKCIVILGNVGSNSLATDPFYAKSTRETFRAFFGKPPKKKVPFLKVNIMSPAYLHFGGALFNILQRWLSTKNLSDEQIKDIDKTKPYWTFPVEWSKTAIIFSNFEQYLSSYWNDKLSEILDHPCQIINEIFNERKHQPFCDCYKSYPEFRRKQNEECKCFVSVNPCPKLCPLCFHNEMFKPYNNPVGNKCHPDTESNSNGIFFSSEMHNNEDPSFYHESKEKVKGKNSFRTYPKKKIPRNAKCSINKKNQPEKLAEFDDPFYRLKLLKMAEKKFKKENEELDLNKTSNNTDPVVQTLPSKKKKKSNKKVKSNQSSSSASSNNSVEKSNKDKSLLAENDQFKFYLSDEESDFSLWDISFSDDSSEYCLMDGPYHEEYIDDDLEYQNDSYSEEIDGQTNHVNPPLDHDNFDLRSVKEKLDIIEKGIEDTGGIGYEEFMLMLQAGKALVNGSKKKQDNSPKKDVAEKKNIEKQEHKKLNTCANCLKKETIPKTFKKCSRCKIDNLKPCYYCSRECQVEDWGERHRDEHLRAN